MQVGDSFTKTTDIGINVKTEDPQESYTFFDVMKTDKELSTTPGLEKMIVLENLIKNGRDYETWISILRLKID